MDKLLIAVIIATALIVLTVEVSDRIHEKDCQWASQMQREYQDFPMASWESQLLESCNK